MRPVGTGFCVEGAWHGDDLPMHPSRKICRCKLGRLAEGLRVTAVVLARNFRIEIRVAEAGEEKLVERGRPKSLGVTPAQRQTLLFERDRHRPCWTHFLAEVGVAVDAESSGGEQMAVEEPRLLLEVARIFLSACVEHGQKSCGRWRCERHEVVLRMDPAVLEVEADKRPKTLGPGVDRLEVGAAALVRDVGRLGSAITRERDRVQTTLRTPQG